MLAAWTGVRSDWRISASSWPGCGCRRPAGLARVAMLPSAEHHCSAGTVNRKLSAISGLYTFHARHGVDLGDLVTELQPGAAAALGMEAVPLPPQRGRAGTAAHDQAAGTPRKHPTILTAGQVQAILDACTRLRDRLLWALLWDTGIRIGEALGLRHEDLAAAEGELTVAPRSNDNRARAKSATPRTIPVSPQLIRLYADYLHDEYGDLDSDYVFVNLWGEPFGHPWSYPAVYDLVLRLRRITGIDFDPHWYRHTYATRLLRQKHPDRGRQHAARAFLDRDHDGHLRASVRRGRPPGSGGGRLPDRAGGAVVTAAVLRAPSAAAPGLLGKLMAAVRPEFRVDILVPERGALVFDTAPCRVAGCVRQPRTRGLCKGHYYALATRRAARTSTCSPRPRPRKGSAARSSRSASSRAAATAVLAGVYAYATKGFGNASGKPDRDAWLAALAPVDDPDHPVCALSYCTLWTQGRSPFCVNHRSRWEAVGRPDIDEFIVLCESYGDDRFDFRPLR